MRIIVGKYQKKVELLKNIFKSGTLSNSLWMLLEQILRIFTGVFIGIYVARYLGPTDFGVLSYGMAISVFLIAIARLGMDSVLLRELVNVGANKISQNNLLSTAFWLMVSCALVVYFVFLIGLTQSNEELLIKNYLAIICASVLFTPFLSIDYFFQSQVRSKITAISKIVTMVLMSVLKIFLIMIEADLYYFVISAFLDYLLLGLSLFFSFSLNIKSFSSQYFNPELIKPLMKSSWLLIIASLAVVLNMRVDQVMIKEFMGFEQAGIYSAAVKFYESWAVFPNTLAISLLPAIIVLRKKNLVLYKEKLIILFRLVFWLSVIASCIISLFSEELVNLTFGAQYADASEVIGIVMWSSVFVALGSVSARYFTVENMEKKIFMRAVLTTFLNIILNLLLIPDFGLKGAAVSTLVCAIISGYILDWFDKDLKFLLLVKHKAVFFIK